MRARAGLYAVATLLGAMGARADEARPVELAPSAEGHLGAWLVVGPFRSSTFGQKSKPKTPDALTTAPEGVDEAQLAPRAGASVGAGARGKPPSWALAASNEGGIDLKAALKASEPDVVGYAAGTLHVARAGKYALLLGVDDGVRVSVDGRVVFLRDEPRPLREDDDWVPLDLAAGDHPILLKLHQRDGGWRFKVRVVDLALRPPADAWLTLPGTTPKDAADLAAKLSWISLDRGLAGDGYRPKLTVKLPEGAPRGVPLGVHVTLTRAADARGEEKALDVDAGEVATDPGATVVGLPPMVGADATGLENGDWVYTVDVAGRSVRLPFFARKLTRDAVAHADRALAAATAPFAEGTLETVRYLRDRLARLVDHGDPDGEAQRAEARELDDDAAALERGVDPYERRTGPMRRAYRSPVDGGLQELGLYVPASYRPGTRRKWPLVVALHGLNGRPMAMLRYFFGGDRKDREIDWEDRHWSADDDDPPLPALDAFVVTPSGHGNAMYRDLGEDDVMRVLGWAMRTYPIDPDRVSITGPSMGGIGTAAVAFRHPDVFAAAAPLCGYHSYFVRRDVLGRPMRPWERVIAEERSNTEWADNGEHLPLWIVHGTQDLPEANSGALIERYEGLHYDVTHDHPNLGHNVWQPTYEGLKGAKWLIGHARVAHPRHVRFRTLRLRDGDDAWVHVRELAAPDKWGEVEASVTSRSALRATTRGVSALAFDRDGALVDETAPLAVTIDGERVTFEASEPAELHREGGAWAKGPQAHEGPWKRGEVTGPIRDAFHAPLLFVYGADDPAQARVNEEVARAWATIRWGTLVKYPVMSDAEFFAKGESVANDRALFLVGNARSNSLVRELEPAFPIAIDGDAVVLGGKRITGAQVGAAFVRPNPRRADRYVVVVEGVDGAGTWRSLSLPDLIPDFVVWDETLAPSRGQVLLGAGALRAAGFFGNDWSLPAKTDDPLAATVRPSAKSEYDATPYLP